MQDGRKAVWSIPYVSVAFLPSLRHNSIAYRFSKVSDCIFEIHQLWQSGFNRVYSNSCCSSSFEAEIIKKGQSSHKIYSNNILNFLVSTIILNACTKKSGNLLNTPHMCVYIYMCVCVCVCVWFGWVLWHINACIFYAKSFLYIYIKYIWFGLVEFYGILTTVCYLIPKPQYAYILNNCMICKHIFLENILKRAWTLFYS